MLKLKLQYFGHLMRRSDSFEKTLMLGELHPDPGAMVGPALTAAARPGDLGSYSFLNGTSLRERCRGTQVEVRCYCSKETGETGEGDFSCVATWMATPSASGRQTRPPRLSSPAGAPPCKGQAFTCWWGAATVACTSQPPGGEDTLYLSVDHGQWLLTLNRHHSPFSLNT